MKKKSEPIVFFGSGPVAATSLRLLAQNFAIEAVITKPRPPHHRGPVPVLELAEALGLEIIIADSRQSLDDNILQRQFSSRVGILIDFGIIVSSEVINHFSLGIINSHFSLLPEWRGADPITFAILSGQKTTGVSLMLLVPKMDEGPLIGQTALDIAPRATTPELTADLIKASYESLCTIVPLYMAGKVEPVPQEQATIAASTTPTYSHKITKEDGQIDWSKPAAQIEREIRAFRGWPQSYTMLADIPAIITSGHVAEERGAPGKVAIKDKQLLVFCGEQALAIERLKPAAKAEMTAAAFIAGYRQRLATSIETSAHFKL